MRWVVGAIVAVGITAAVLFAAYKIESRGQKKSANDKHVLVVDLEPEHHDDYVVTCDEARFQKGFEQLRRFVKVEAPLLTVPGGPIVIALSDVDLPMELLAPKRVAVEVLKRYAPKRVVLVAHQGCLFYDSIGAWRGDSTDVRNLQIVYLLRAKEVLRTWLPQTQVELYYGENTGANQMRFFPVDGNTVTELRPSPK